MNIELLVQDSRTGKIKDISELVTDVTWETQLTGQPGKLSFNYLFQNDLTFSEGSVVKFTVNTKGVFYGYIFTVSTKESKVVSVTAYDQMRYLKNKSTYVLSDKTDTASSVFTKICKDFNLSYKVVDPSNYMLTERIFDDKTLFEIIETTIDETLAFSGNWYMIRDNFGVLEFCNLNNLKTNLVIGDSSLLTGYNFERSIDSDTYNQIKLSQENKTTKKREVYIVHDTNTMKTWGTLQYTDKLSEDVNPAQIEEMATRLLTTKNRITKSLSLNCIGDLRVTPGCGVVLSISDLVHDGVNLNEYYMVTSVSHKFNNNQHIMTVELQVSV